MMTQESIDKVLSEIKEWTLGDWERVKARVDEHFAEKAKQIELGEDGVHDVRRLVAMENDWPYASEMPKQTRMEF